MQLFFLRPVDKLSQEKRRYERKSAEITQTVGLCKSGRQGSLPCVEMPSVCQRNAIANKADIDRRLRPPPVLPPGKLL